MAQVINSVSGGDKITVTKTKTTASSVSTSKKKGGTFEYDDTITSSGGATLQSEPVEEYYPTVMMYGTNSMPKADNGITTVYVKPSNPSVRNVVDENASFRRMDEINQRTTMEVVEDLREEREFEKWRSTPPESVGSDTPEPIKKVQVSLAQVSTSLSKQAKYKKLAQNLSTLYRKIEKEGADAANRKRTGADIVSGVGVLLSAIPFIGPVASGIAQVTASAMNKEAADQSYMVRAERINQLSENVIGYMESLENRDTILNNAMNSITTTMNDMRMTYGNSFVDQFYNLMLAKSGMTSDAYSVLTGNFRTFNNGPYGTASGEDGMFDELTSGNDMFNNIYKQLTMEDLAGIENSLTQALYSDNATLGEQLRSSENDLRTQLRRFITSQEGSVSDMMAQLTQLASGQRQEEIGYAEQLGSAEAQRATSGFRGGTATANEALTRLSADLGRIASSAQVSALINSFKYQMRQQELNASSMAYNYRSAQKQMKLNAYTASISGWNNIGQTSYEAGKTSNALIDEATTYKEETERIIEEEEFTEEEADIIIEGLGI